MNEKQKYPLLAVVGPTASGKSKLAVELAQHLNGEIVSCDSMQIYRRMDIGTAKPIAAEMGGVPHHLLSITEPDQPFSCADYVLKCRQVIADTVSRGKLPVLCGGTGLYLERLLFGGTGQTETAPDPAIRQKWREYYDTHGTRALHDRLTEVDPVSAAAIHENNIPRVIRALEIYDSTGVAKSEWDRRTRLSAPDYAALVLGLRFRDREELYRRINGRVDQMLRDGLVDETKRLLDEGIFEVNSTAAQAIGYKELLPYLRGEESLESAAGHLRQATRRYAKRQMTWFSAKQYVHWLFADSGSVLEDALQIVKDFERASWGNF